MLWIQLWQDEALRCFKCETLVADKKQCWLELTKEGDAVSKVLCEDCKKKEEVKDATK